MKRSSKLHTTFAIHLRNYRDRLRLTRNDLALQVGKSYQYIAALEQAASDKVPSLDTLAALIRVLARPITGSADATLSARESRAIAADLAFSALGLHFDHLFGIQPANITEELSAQSHASSIWIVSDQLAESLSQRYAARTAEHVRQGVSYTFFLPFSGRQSQWERALKWIAAHATESEMQEKIVVYQVSDVAFFARLRITNPHGDDRTAVYNLGPSTSGPEHALFYPAPMELVVDVVRALSELLLLYQQQPADPGDGIVTDARLGSIRRVFPNRE